VGEATGRGFIAHGHDVTFVDINPARLESLRADGLNATDTLDLSGPPAFVFLTLPTPHKGRDYDMGPFRAGVSAVGRAIGTATSAHTVLVRSTVAPGTSDEIVQPLLEMTSGRTVGDGFYLASAPEFLRAVSAAEDFLHPWMTVVASRDPQTAERVAELFRPFGGELRIFSNPVTVELIKASHNVFNATKISYWNEIWRVCQELGVDADEVSSTVALSAEGSINPQYGIRGGAPYGGACLPKDVAGFLGLADRLGIDVPVVEGVAAVNLQMELIAASAAGEPVVDLRDVSSAESSATL